MSLVHEDGVMRAVTLVTTGGVVFGKILPEHVFWESTASVVAETPTSDAAAAAAKSAEAETYRQRAASAAPSDLGERKGPSRYIHLGYTRIYAGNTYVEVGLWRGEISKVVGWSFGLPTTHL